MDFGSLIERISLIMNDILNKDLASEPVTIETKPILINLVTYATGRRKNLFQSMDKIR